MARRKPQTARDYDLRAWRRSHGLNQGQAARLLNVNQGYFSRLERGRQCPSGSLALKLSRLTGIALERLLACADQA